ncbi:hypothetical protein SAMN04487914_1637 [Arthrobacter sp. ok909]|uniref:ACT domain-containing protein n=1 Tax=Arthrobacter sp. ok909 TaxID=1761746 RepID=UPI0008806EF4|nr:hypothetical protein SAMN04487914_1637 [Arthrobacter sp. ok909]
MSSIPVDNVAAELSCEACGRLPEPPKTRLTVANIAAMLPLELATPAAMVHTALPNVVKILILAITTCILGIWVAEPSAMRLLRSWLHAPALRHRRRLATSPALWRARASIDNKPGAVKRLTHVLSRHHVNILSIQVHPPDDIPHLPRDARVLVELVISAAASQSEQQLLDIIGSGRAQNRRVWPTTALAQSDGQTKALSLAARIAANPDELPLAAAELLCAQVINPATTVAQDSRNILKIPSSLGRVLLSRPSEPFTPAESARAHRLAELAETVALTPRAASPAARPRRGPHKPGRIACTPHALHTRTTSCPQASRRDIDATHTHEHSGSGR